MMKFSITVDKNTLPVVTVGGKVLSWKPSVVYLGSRIAEDEKTLVAVKHRICCAEEVVKHLNTCVFQRRAVNSKLKGHLIQVCGVCFIALWTRALRVQCGRLPLP